MKTTKIWDALTALTASEQRQLLKAAASPLYNQRADVRLFLETLVKLLQKDGDPSKMYVFAQAFPTQPYQAAYFNQLCTWGYQLIEHIVQAEESRFASVKEKLQILRAWKKRHKDALFHKTWREAQQTMEQLPFRQQDYYQLKYELMVEEYEVVTTQNRFNDGQWQDMINCLNDYMVVLKLKQACLRASQQSVMHSATHDALLPPVLAYVVKQHLTEHPVIGIFYQGYRLLSEVEATAYFATYVKLVETHWQLFLPEEARDLYLLALNFCIRKSNGGYVEFAEKGLALYQSAIRKGVLLQRNQLSRFTFRNVVSFGIRTRQFETVYQFIRDFGDYLEPQHKEATLSFNTARLAFEQGKYADVLLLLQKADYKDPLLNVAAKMMLLKVYYEAQEYEALSSHLEAMEGYLRRKKALTYHRQNYLTIIKLVKKLMTLRPKNQTQIQQLKNTILQQPQLTEFSWLLAQVAELA